MPTILIIEDAKDIRILLAHLLETSGYRVIQADDGDTGFRLWQQHHPDLVITDLIMPGKDGLDIIRQLRIADGRTKVIAMSGAGYRGNVNLLEEATRLGAVGAIPKPFSINEVLRLVKDVLSA